MYLLLITGSTGSTGSTNIYYFIVYFHIPEYTTVL